MNLFLIPNKAAAVAVKKITLLLVPVFFVQVLLAQGITYITVCPKSYTTLNSINLLATNYQWQINTGSGFTDLSDDAHYSGSGDFSMQILNLPTAWYGYQYRCVADGIADTNIYSLKFVTTWTNFTDNWSDKRNWSCGALPDSTIDVLIDYGGEVIIDVNAICRSLTLNPNASVIVDPGVNLTIVH